MLANLTSPPAGMNRTGRWSLVRDLAPVAVLFVLLMFVAPLLLSDFRQGLLAKYLTFAILAIGIDLIWGYTGILSLGQAVWFGLGGYAMAMYLKLVASGDAIPDFMTWSGVREMPWFWEPFEFAWFALPLAVIGPGLLGFVFGLLMFRSRLKGAYFAIVSQALAMILGLFLVAQQGYTGGTSGITNFSTLFGQSLASQDTKDLLYIATVVALVLTYLIALWITRSRMGRVLVAIRDDEERVRFAGYNVAFYKALIFAVSAAMAGLAGALFVPQVGAITPSAVGIVPSIEYVLLVAVGGRGTLSGAVVGAIVVSWLRSTLSETFPETWVYFYGALFIGAVLLFPTGIVGFARMGQEFIARQVRRLRSGSAPGPSPARSASEVEAQGVSGAE